VKPSRSAFTGQRHPLERPPSLSTLDDISLRGEVRGWYARPSNGVVIVFAHGAPGDRTSLLPEARFLAGAGYGFVVLDFPGHGESKGEVHWGVPSRRALQAAVDFAISDTEVTGVGLFGFSMGSSVVAQVAAWDPRVAAVVMSGAFTSADEQIRHEHRGWRSLLRWPAILGSRKHAPRSELVTTPFVSRIAPRPLLLVAGGRDAICPPWMTERLFAAACEPKEMFVLEGARHGRYLEVDPGAYLERVKDFYDRAFR
jgi:uncharacterized protein